MVVVQHAWNQYSQLCYYQKEEKKIKSKKGQRAEN